MHQQQHQQQQQQQHINNDDDRNSNSNNNTSTTTTTTTTTTPTPIHRINCGSRSPPVRGEAASAPLDRFRLEQQREANARPVCQQSG